MPKTTFRRHSYTLYCAQCVRCGDWVAETTRTEDRKRLMDEHECYQPLGR